MRSGLQCCGGQRAQVTDFYANGMDLTAQQTRYQRLDVQGNKCALIRVQVIADNVIARGSVIGDVVKFPGEYWVYMPGGAKMVKIQSDNFLPLMYEYPEPLHGGVTYTMVIEIPGAAQQAPKTVRQGYLLVRVTPPTARLTIGNEEYDAKDGLVKVLLRNGNYTYRVEASGYFPAEGSVTIDGKTMNQEVTLRSSKPQLSVRTTTPQTKIYINGELRGTGAADCEVVAGLYEVEGRLDGHRSLTQTVELSAGEHREVVIPALTPIYGALNIDYEPVGAKIVLDSREVGVSRMVINDVLVGEHTLMVSAPDYETKTLTAKVNEAETAQITGTLNKDEKDLVPFDRNRKYGYKDENGREVIAPKYDDAYSFSNGKAKVELNGVKFYIDKEGNRLK